MDLALYFQLFWLPAVASICLLALLLVETDPTGRTTLLLAGWFLLAATLQYLATLATSVWIVGLTLQTTLAVFLALRRRLSP